MALSSCGLVADIGGINCGHLQRGAHDDGSSFMAGKQLEGISMLTLSESDAHYLEITNANRDLLVSMVSAYDVMKNIYRGRDPWRLNVRVNHPVSVSPQAAAATVITQFLKLETFLDEKGSRIKQINFIYLQPSFFLGALLSFQCRQQGVCLLCQGSIPTQALYS
ncbi:hypothetical protein E2542_SST17708 [Spatholobus suberectus]|nr:hypothetical protein E2542_SST17708 [Spatholobus suberectus]